MHLTFYNCPQWLKRYARQAYRRLHLTEWHIAVYYVEVDAVRALARSKTAIACAVPLLPYKEASIYISDAVTVDADRWRTVYHEFAHVPYEEAIYTLERCWEQGYTKKQTREAFRELTEKLAQHEVLKWQWTRK